MRLLFDENLSARLTSALADVYPGSVHLADVGLLGASDDAVWTHAARNGMVLVTKDDDFQRLSVMRGHPPKVVWIRLGNCSTLDVARLLRLRRDEIEVFLAHDDATFLALG